MKQDCFSFNHGKVVSSYIVYEISKSINISDYPTLENCLFWAISLTKKSDIEKNKYSGYGTGFDRHGSFSSPGIEVDKNVIVFEVNMSSSAKIDSRKKIFWFWVKAQGRD